MSPSTKSLLKGFLIALTAVVVVSFAGYAIHAKADGPSKADYANLAAIKANQKVLSKDRKAYTEFVNTKADNEQRTAAINADGWNVDWSTMQLIPNSPKPLAYDPIKVAKAISCSETSCGKDGTAIHRNNCCGIMTWRTGTRQPKYFPTYTASLHEAAAIWDKSYGKLPDLQLAKKWTGDDRAEDWLKTFYTAYNSLD